MPPSEPKDRLVYQEFGGSTPQNDATQRPELPIASQNLRIQASRKGRKGKTVTVITGFQSSEENLTGLLKQLKAQCGAGGTLKEQEIEIQGDHTQKILQFLIKQGYKAKISGG